MDVIEKYGKTNTVAKICEAYGVPLEHGFAIADRIIHGRDGYSYRAAHFWAAHNFLGFNGRKKYREFTFDLGALRTWMHDQWQK